MTSKHEYDKMSWPVQLAFPVEFVEIGLFFGCHGEAVKTNLQFNPISSPAPPPPLHPPPSPPPLPAPYPIHSPFPTQKSGFIHAKDTNSPLIITLHALRSIWYISVSYY